MTKQDEKAKPLLSALQSETFFEAATQQFVKTMAEHEDNPLQACMGAYYTFAQNFAKNYYGFAHEHVAPDTSPYLPENIGCNAPKMIGELFNQQTFNLEQSPVDQIKALGIESQKAMQFDLNNDGQDEWLIWLQIPMPPFFFTPDGNRYHVEQVNVNPYLGLGEMTTWRLPEDVGNAIIFKTQDIYRSIENPPWFAAYNGMDGYGGSGEVCVADDGKTSNFIAYRMWRMEGHTLEPILTDVLCRSEVKDLFPQGEGSRILDGGRYKIDDGYSPVVFKDIKYIWDNTEKIFKPVETPKTSTPAVTPTAEPKYYAASGALIAQDYQAVVEMTNHMSLDEYVKTAYSPKDAVITLTGDYYLRALALQHLGREQEAVEALLKTIELAPNEQWKQLARLYLEAT